jgi:protein-disulfide isomerase
MKEKHTMRLAAFLLLSITAFAQTKTAFDKATLEKYLRRVEVFPVAVDIKIDDPKPSKYLPGFSEVAVHFSHEQETKDELYYVSKDGQTIIQGDPSAITVFNINQSPFQPNLDLLRVDNQPSFGPPNAPVTIVEFGDLECPSCKAEAPIIREIIPMTYADKVRVVFKDYPLELIHPWARAASDAGRCIFHQNAPTFWKFYDWMYQMQEGITPGILNAQVLEWAGKNGLDTAKLGACMESKEYDSEVAANIAEGKALGVRGTPSLFVNGHKIGGVEWPVLEGLIKTEMDAAKR